MIFSRAAATTTQSLKVVTTRRALSSHGSMALSRLQNALEDYRVKEYQGEIPTRFKKEIVRAAVAQHASTGRPSNDIRLATPTPSNGEQPFVVLEGLRRVLINIGAEHKVALSDLETLFAEMGSGQSKMIPAQQMIQML